MYTKSVNNLNITHCNSYKRHGLQNESFKGGDNVRAVKTLVDALDFNSKQVSAFALKTIYAVIIGARILLSRDINEVKETTLRDTLGWMSWFYVSPAIEDGVGYLLNKRSKKKAGHPSDWVDLVMKPGGEKTKSLYEAIAPWKDGMTLPFAQIDNLKTSISKNNFDALQYNKATAFVISLAAAISALGLFIPWLNTQLTRKRVLKSPDQTPSLINQPSTKSPIEDKVSFLLKKRTPTQDKHPITSK